MKITIETIPHEKQRYPTVGDWTIAHAEDGSPIINICVSREAGDWRAQALVAIHEAIEAIVCIHDGVTQAQVDAFDVDFEKYRHPDNVDEPGDSKAAPYYKQHQIATAVERILAVQLDVAWNHYAKAVERL